MENNIQQKDARSIFAVIIGIILGVLVFFVVAFLMSVYEYATHHTEQGVIPGDIRADFVIPVVLGSLVAGFFTAVKSYRGKLVCSAITGAVLIIGWLTFGVAPHNPVSVKLSAWLILPSAMIGGWLGSRYKKREKPGS
jgi:hypothetical protein